MADPKQDVDVPLVRNLAVITQLRLPGTAGRLAQQIRDLETAAPLFSEAGLVRKVERPVPLNVRAAGIASATPPPFKVMGGFLYAAGGLRLDLIVDDNRVSTGTQASVCEVDDIDFEDQRNRLRLIGIRQAYELADAAMRDEQQRDLLLLDCPLLLSRSMVAPRQDAAHRAHREAYEAAMTAIDSFWRDHRQALFPWRPDGPVVVAIGTGRYAAVERLATQDLRTSAGRDFVLPGEAVDPQTVRASSGIGKAIGAIGHQRFLQGIVGPFSRTAAYRLNVQSPRMEPSGLADGGVVGFHFKAAEGTSVRFAHMLGDPKSWSRQALDRVGGLLMSLCAVGGREAVPLPIMLAERELRPLGRFLENYARQVRAHLHSRDLERGWLEGLGDLD